LGAISMFDNDGLKDELKELQAKVEALRGYL
jgi:hypothetical protein